MIQAFVEEVKTGLNCKDLTFQYASTGNTMIEKLFDHLEREFPEGSNEIYEDDDFICKRSFNSDEKYQSTNITINGEDSDRLNVIRVFLNDAPLYFISASDDSLITLFLLRYS